MAFFFGKTSGSLTHEPHPVSWCWEQNHPATYLKFFAFVTNVAFSLFEKHQALYLFYFVVMCEKCLYYQQ